MTTRFISEDLWTTLTAAAKKNKRICHVAVAYFGQGGSKRLPLYPGSYLVVDASESTVKSGLTCPDELIELQKRGVKIFSVPNLHAKIYVIGRSAFIGSANVSGHSANTLVEALLCTTDPKAVSGARQFVIDSSIQEYGPEMLKELSKIYRPPHRPGGKRMKAIKPVLPPLYLEQLCRTVYSDYEKKLYKEGLLLAKKNRQHSRGFELDYFVLDGNCRYKLGDVIIQVTDEGKGKVFVSPPGNVLNVRTGQDDSGQVSSIVYLECPVKKRRALKTISRQLGRWPSKLFRKNGVVHTKSFARDLLNLWTR